MGFKPPQTPGGDALSNLVNASTNTTAAAGDVVFVDTTSGPVTITLPTTPAALSQVVVKKVNDDSGASAVTVVAHGSGLIDRASDYVITDFNGSATFQNLAADTWKVISEVGPLSAQSGSGGATLSLTPSGDTSGATDQAAVASAIADLLNNSPAGGSLRLAAGDWYWNSQQIDIYTVPARLRIFGDGQATKIHSTATGTAATGKALFYVYGGGDVAAYPDQSVQGATALNWLEISDLWLEGNSHACGIALDGVYQGRIADIYGHGFTAASEYGTALWMNKSIDLVIENLNTFGNNYGAYLKSWCNINNFIGGWFASAVTAGIHLEAGDAYCEGNKFWGSIFQTAGVYGIDIGAAVQGTGLYGCWIENNSRGVRNAGTDTLVDQATFSSNGHDFEVLAASVGLTIRKPHFAVGATPSMTVASGSTRTVIEDSRDLTYAAVTDATNGAEVDFARSKHVTRTVATSGATQTIPAQQTADLNVLTLTANCTITFPHPVQGKTIWLTLVQDGTGSRTATWDTAVKWPSDTAPTLTTTASKADRFRFDCDDGTHWYGQVLGQALAITTGGGGGGGGGGTGPALSTLRGSPTYSAGQFINALSGGVLAPASTITVGTTGTIEFWLKSNSTDNTVVALGNGDAWIGFRSGAIAYAPPGLTARTSGNADNDGNWHHVAVSTNGTVTKMFVDGVQVVSETLTMSLTWANLAIGGYGADGSLDWQGQVDEVRISNIARYTSAFTPSASAFTADGNTVALYHLDS